MFLSDLFSNKQRYKNVNDSFKILSHVSFMCDPLISSGAAVHKCPTD